MECFKGRISEQLSYHKHQWKQLKPCHDFYFFNTSQSLIDSIQEFFIQIYIDLSNCEKEIQ